MPIFVRSLCGPCGKPINEHSCPHLDTCECALCYGEIDQAIESIMRAAQ